MREEGKVLAIGASNYSPEELKSAIAASSEMNRPGLSACQVHYNMIERRAGESLSQICTEKGISLVCNRALARGILTGKYVSGRPFPPSSRAALSDRVRRWATDSTVSMVEGLQRVAQRIGATTTAMSLAWLVQQSAVGVVLVGTRNIAQLNDCLVAGDMVLDADTNDAIEQVIGSHGMTDQVNRLPEEYFER
jgi:aryl-alcohol dehydrogenase-like predicted oxidoreductase